MTVRRIPVPLRPSSGVGDAPIGEQFRYTWKPRAGLSADLPAGFRVVMDCVVRRDGVRRFAPAGGVRAFLLEASLGGLAILGRARGLDAEGRFAYHAMRLLFQYAPLLREHLGRSFTRVSDLLVAASERAGRDGKDILPASVGLDREGRGRRWSVTELLRRGREQALESGHVGPDPAQCIASGLLAAARLDPLDPRECSGREALGLVRVAVFDPGPAAGVTEADKRVVAGRLLESLAPHISDDTATFNRRFFAGRNNLVHRIAKRKKGSGPIPRGVVHQALVGLTFDAFTHVGDCVCMQMQAFLQALSSPLDERERALFGCLYLKSPHLGGLPLILLRDRFGFLKEAVLDVFAAPGEPGPFGVLLRLLQYYEEMASARREVDRGLKRRGHHDRAAGRVARTVPPDVEMSGAPAAAPDGLFLRIAARLRGDRGITCACPDAGSWMARVLDGGDGGAVLHIDVECEGCGHCERVDVGRGEFERIGRELGVPGHRRPRSGPRHESED